MHKPTGGRTTDRDAEPRQVTCHDCAREGREGWDVVLSPIFRLHLCMGCWLARYTGQWRGKQEAERCD